MTEKPGAGSGSGSGFTDYRLLITRFSLATQILKRFPDTEIPCIRIFAPRVIEAQVNPCLL